MNTLKINRRKLEEFEIQSFRNALRLHFDSVLLLKKKSFASAFALSVIASEEFGKGFAIDEVLYQSLGGGKFYEEDVKFVRALLSNHKLKQDWFARIFFSPFRNKYLFKKYAKIQTDKNNAIYVGVRKGNHQLIQPLSVSGSKAKSQIALVNKALTEFSKRRLAENDEDADVWDEVFRRKQLLRKLTNVSI